jgi:NDP-sugar pyrophosphorylase family protein
MLHQHKYKYKQRYKHKYIVQAQVQRTSTSTTYKRKYKHRYKHKYKHKYKRKYKHTLGYYYDMIYKNCIIDHNEIIVTSINLVSLDFKNLIRWPDCNLFQGHRN